MAKRRKAPATSGQDYAKQVLADEYSGLVGDGLVSSVANIGLGKAADKSYIASRRRADDASILKNLHDPDAASILLAPHRPKTQSARDAATKKMQAAAKSERKWSGVARGSLGASALSYGSILGTGIGFMKAANELDKAKKQIADTYPAIQQAKATNEAIKFHKSKSKRSK